MTNREDDIEFAHLSWHPDRTIMGADPLARTRRELSNISSEQSTGQVSPSYGSPASSNGIRVPPSIAHRLLRIGHHSPGSHMSPVSNPDVRGRQANDPVSHLAPTPQTVSVDDRFLNFSQVLEQTFAQQPELQSRREAFVRLRQKAAEAVEPTLKALRAWDEPDRQIGATLFMYLKQLTSPITKHSTPSAPSTEKLLELVHHYFPPRGEIPIYVCDFGEGQAHRFITTLGEVESRWEEKPSWAKVRWIHAPLGWGLTHSSVEDLFRHASGNPWPFRNVAGPNWPYLSCEVFSLENRNTYKRTRDVGILAGKVPGLSQKLEPTKFRGDKNTELQSDIDWRANHVGSNAGYMDLARNDIGYQLNDGRGLGYNGPREYVRHTDTKLDEQILRQFPFFEEAQIVRCPFRTFHRPDGFVLTMSAMRGVNYLDKKLPEYLMEPPECLFENSDASVLSQVWRVFSETGTKSWRDASAEWFLVYLMTELVCTPHQMAQGSNAPTIQAAYQMIIQDFKRRRFDNLKRGESIKLVQEYIMCTDELSILVHIMSKQLDFLYRLRKDCELLDADQRSPSNALGKTAVSRCDWAITNVEENFSVLDAMLKDLRGSMVAVSDNTSQNPQFPFAKCFRAADAPTALSTTLN